MTEEAIALDSHEFPQLDSFKLDPLLHDGVRVVLLGTAFKIFGRKQNVIGIDRLINAVKLTWPRWTSHFEFKFPDIKIIETDWGLGGGSLGAFLLAVHLRDEYDEASSKYLESVLGWPAQPTGRECVREQFAHFSDPMQTYVNDQIVHELGHVFFLHGLTDVKDDGELWFGLGMGLVYDRLIWAEISETPSPVFDAFNSIWKERFAGVAEIDQRLINPDTKNDKDYGLVRLQTYGHAKAHAYLSELRCRIGTNKFDGYVRTYLARPIGSAIEYEGFLALFSEEDLRVVRVVESEFVIR